MDAHGFQIGDDLQLDSARLRPAPFEVAARVVGQGTDGVRGEEEELDLRRDEVAKSGRLGLVQECAQCAAPGAWIRLSAWRHDLTDEPSAGHAGRLPDREGRGVGAKVHVRLDLASQALDRRDRKSTRLNSSHAHLSYAV